MKLFLSKLSIFVLPISILFIFPVFVVTYGREYVSYKDVVIRQEKDPSILFGFAYNGVSFYPYKEFLTKRKRAQVVALGTSRVMQIRKEFFIAGTTFVNAGGAGKSVAAMKSFIESLPDDGSVKVVLLGLDVDVISGEKGVPESIGEDILPLRFSEIVVTMSRRIYLDYISHKYTLGEIIHANSNSSSIGISALLHDDGFRGDGSYKYGVAMKNLSRATDIREQIAAHAKDISNSSYNLETKKKNIEKNLAAIDELISIAKKKNIEIIGFIPPYPTPVHDALTSNGDLIGYTSQSLSDLFVRRQLSYFDVSSITTFGGKETEFVDFNHGTDVLYLRMMMYMADRSESLSKLTNINLLKAILKKSQSDFLDF